jgi:hypothetical protein
MEEVAAEMAVAEAAVTSGTGKTAFVFVAF